MKLAPQSREILRQYKALINARRRDAGQRELTTVQVMDEICYYMTLSVCRVHRRSFHLTGWKKPVSRMAGVRPGGRLSARAKNRAGCACRREASPRLRRRVLSSLLSVAVARECAYYPGYLPVTQIGDAYVEVEYRLFLKRRSG